MNIPVPGASNKPERYRFKAVRLLREKEAEAIMPLADAGKTQLLP